MTIFAPLPELKTIALTLPEPPSANRYWRHNRGRVHLSTEAVHYRKTVADAVRKIGIRSPMDCAVTVVFRWFRGRRSGDLDNRTKQLFDALQGCAFVKDSQIVEIHAYRDDSDLANPRAEVTIIPTDVG